MAMLFFLKMQQVIILPHEASREKTQPIVVFIIIKYGCKRHLIVKGILFRSSQINHVTSQSFWSKYLTDFLIPETVGPPSCSSLIQVRSAPSALTVVMILMIRGDRLTRRPLNNGTITIRSGHQDKICWDF